MPTQEQLAAHRAWQNRDRMPQCAKCDCRGNQECGNAPLGVPDHRCELDIGSDGERGWCWCCRIAEKAKE